MSSEGTAARSERLLRLERALVRVRWFGIALGLFQTFSYAPNPGTVVPTWLAPVASAQLGLLALVNGYAVLVTRRRPDERGLRRLGAQVFLADVAVVWGIVWAFSFEPYGSTWVMLSVLSLEGALRYQMRGALLPALLAIPIETAREAAGAEWFGRMFFATSITFRVGYLTMIGSVAGFMSRNVERERVEAERRAAQLAELAQRERDARRESTAFQDVILAGVSEANLRDALRSMAQHIARALGYERLIVLLLEDDGRLYPIATHNIPAHVLGASLALGEGISGTVALTRRTEIVPDVRIDPRYHPAVETTRSQIAVPITMGDRVMGVLDVESDDPDAFDESDRSRLERLGAQMALVIEQARLLAQERSTVERLRELDAMKSDFVAIASHELRTPLTSMKGSIRTLRRGDVDIPPGERDELLAMLDRQSERLTRLVDDLLIASRIDAGRVAARVEKTDVREVFDEMLDELGTRALRVSLAIASPLPPVLTDGQRLGQVARNLIENAVKFAPEDTPVLVTVHHDGETLLLEVRDEGPGIAASEVPRIFDRFYQVGGSMRRHAEGFGLGLYITKRLVEVLGGEIDVDSRVGRGTTFRVRVPAPTASGGDQLERSPGDGSA